MTPLHVTKKCDYCGAEFRPREAKRRFCSRACADNRRGSPIERFERYALKTQTCWLWQGEVGSNGYGRIKVKGRNIGAHRFSYQEFVGDIPDDFVVHHVCRTRNCVNPAHLQATSQSFNVLVADRSLVTLPRRTHCKRGHEMIGSNVKLSKDGKRNCRTCCRDANRAFMAKKRGTKSP